jgi:hypothetical protein
MINKINSSSVNVTMDINGLALIQLAIGHLALSINNGSFDAGTKASQIAVMDNLQVFHTKIDRILNNFS